MEPDIVEGLVDDMLAALDGGNLKQAILAAGQIKGMCQVAINEQEKWGLIREEYEGGSKPRDLAERYHETPRAITVRAHSQGWMSPAKLKKHLKPTKKQTFIHNCHLCENPFEATSGHAKVCPTCKAFKTLDEIRRKTQL
jgi:rubrerythrin